MLTLNRGRLYPLIDGFDYFVREFISVKETRKTYMLLLKKYQEFVAKEDVFFKSNPRLIEQKIIEFILHLKQQGKSYAAIRIYLAAVKSFYKINDIFLNDSKISTVMQRKLHHNNFVYRERSHVLIIHQYYS
jgi:site-specific recombinase XerD